MMKRLKSKTYWLNFGVMGLGILVTNFDSIKPLLGEHAGIAFIVISVLGMALREITKGSIQDK